MDKTALYLNFLEKQEKIAGRGKAALLGGAISPLLSGLAADKGKGWRTMGGSLAGATLGNIAGGPLGAYLGSSLGGALGGAAAGSAAGAYLAHGKNKKRKLDPVGKEDADVNNDKKVDSSDKYLMTRRRAVARAIKSRTK